VTAHRRRGPRRDMTNHVSCMDAILQVRHPAAAALAGR
jgi:hypothetical protein